jgi:hypothetical protein
MRGSSQLPTTTRPTRQLSLSFGTQPLSGLSPIDRARTVALLAFLLAQAAGVVTEERDDVER